MRGGGGTYQRHIITVFTQSDAVATLSAGQEATVPLYINYYNYSCISQ